MRGARGRGQERTLYLVSRRLRAAWITIASLSAFAAVEIGLEARRDGESFASATPVLVFASVVVLLAAVSYGLHRIVDKALQDEAWRQAALDAFVAGIVGPLLWFLLAVAETLQECTFGPGC